MIGKLLKTGVDVLRLPIAVGVDLLNLDGEETEKAVERIEEDGEDLLSILLGED